MNLHPTSKLEKQLWILAGFTLVGILCSLFLTRQLIPMEFIQENQTSIYVGSFLCVTALMVALGLHRFLFGPLIWGIIGILTIYLMVAVRLEMSPAERTHLFEYGLFSVFVYQALKERKKNIPKTPNPVLAALLITFVIGLLDECIQYILPGRVFDLRDLVFNNVAAIGGVGSNWLLGKIKFRKNVT